MIITRFAPSPTGMIHVGNARTALMCYLLAHSKGGKFMLRLDDTDTERNREEYAEGIRADLRWLGLEWDIFARQSERMARYEEIKQKLIQGGRLYPCYETPEEIEVKRKILLGRGLPPIYDRAALKLSEDEKKKLEAEGRAPHWRFKLDETAAIEWDDLIKGKQRFEAKHLSDPVLIRANGSPTYMLPSAIDDMDFGITHVVRGEDHVTNTAIQIQLFEAIGSHIPQFAHTSLIKTKEGKISKRVGGFSIESLRDMGIAPMAINSLLAKIGTSDAIEPRQSLAELQAEFDLGKFGRASANYEVEEVERLNARLLHQLPFNEAEKKLQELGIPAITQTFWEAVRPNLNTLEDVKEWQRICDATLLPIIGEEDKAFTEQAAQLLPPEPWDNTTWKTWLETIKQGSDRKGKALFLPLRLALTAQEHGPELHALLPLIGRTKALARLLGNPA